MWVSAFSAIQLSLSIKHPFRREKAYLPRTGRIIRFVRVGQGLHPTDRQEVRAAPNPRRPEGRKACCSSNLGLAQPRYSALAGPSIAPRCRRFLQNRTYDSRRSNGSCVGYSCQLFRVCGLEVVANAGTNAFRVVQARHCSWGMGKGSNRYRPRHSPLPPCFQRGGRRSVRGDGRVRGGNRVDSAKHNPYTAWHCPVHTQRR
jgi:hypothetical protein